jgi:hypothetical protein
MLLFPTLAWGADLQLLPSVSLEYDDNVFRVSEGQPKDDDVVLRLHVAAVLEERTQKLDYSLGFSTPFTVGILTDRVSDFDQFVRGRFAYRLSDKTRIYGSDNLSFVRSLSKRYEDPNDPLAPLEISRQKSRNTVNNASLGISHSFTSDLSGSLTLAHRFFDTTREDRRQVNTVSASGNLSYAVDSKNRIGAGINFTHQDFDDLPGNPGSKTMIYRIFASWVYRFDETLSFTVRAGPTLFDSEQGAAERIVSVNSEVPFVDWTDDVVVVSPIDSCGVLAGTGGSQVIPWNQILCDPGQAQWVDRNVQTALYNAIKANEAAGPYNLRYPIGQAPGAESGQQVDFFANATLSKRWSPRLSSSLAYQRSETGASGLGGTAILDSVTATTSWRATELWNVGVRADWTKRSSVFPTTQTLREVVLWDDPGVGIYGLAAYSGTLISNTVDEDIDTQRWGVAARLERSISRKMRASLRLTYNRQKSKSGTSGETSDFNNFIAVVGLQYQFDRMELW